MLDDASIVQFYAIKVIFQPFTNFRATLSLKFGVSEWKNSQNYTTYQIALAHNASAFPLSFLKCFFKFPSYFLYCISILDNSSVLQFYGSWCVRIMLNFSVVFLLQKHNSNIMKTIIFLFWIQSTNHRDHQQLFMVLAETKNL